MSWNKKISAVMLASALTLGLGAKAVADDKTRNTVIGAGIGGVAGALLSDGDGWATLGGAAAGGVLGNVITDDDDDDRRDRRRWDRRGDRDGDYRRASWHKYDREDRHRWKHRHRDRDRDDDDDD